MARLLLSAKLRINYKSRIMKPKKNPEADLSRRTGLYFAIGLAVTMVFSLWAINFRTSTGEAGKVKLSDVDQKIEEVVEDINMNTPPPPPPPPPPPAPTIPDVIEEVKDEQKVETNLGSTDSNKEEKVPEQPKIETPAEPDEPDVDVPFAIIEDKPMFESCKNVPKEKRDECFKNALDNHVKKNFRYPESAMEMGIQGRVFVQFRINKTGKVEVIGVRGPDKSLEAEARRIIEKMPDIIPGKQRGKAVAVTYAYPIMFKLN